MGYPQLKTCTECNEEKPTMAFQRSYSKQRGKYYYKTRCRECYKKYKASLPPSIAKADLYGDTIVCIKCKKEKPKENFYSNTTSGYVNKKCKPCFDAANNYKERCARLRQKCLEAYGSKCNCCSETIERFLTFDHVNDDGAEHRSKVSPGYSMYVWLKKNDYPDTIQVLCYNCNNAKKFGTCPHKTNH